MAACPCGLCRAIQNMFLLLVDAHLKWPEIVEMSSTTVDTTIAILKRVFAAYGLPEQLVSDNGPQFVSHEFADFLRANGVKYIRTAPYHPSSNRLWNDWYRRSSSRWRLVSMVGWHCSISCRIFWWHTEVLHMLLLDNLQHHCSWDDQFQLGLICCAQKWARRWEEFKLVRSIIMMLMLVIVNLQWEVGW